MKNLPVTFRLLIIILVSLLPLELFSQVKGNANDFQPVVGQGGKDVVWVPTPQELVDKMLDIAKITTKDLLIDLGSGDGRTVITAAKRGTRAIGVEYNPEMVALSERNAAREGVSGKAEFLTADLFEYDFSKATVITMFLLPDINIRLRPIILSMKPGARVVSNTFTMGEWIPDDTVDVEEVTIAWHTAYMWIVPARVEGRWALQSGGDISLLQEFQMLKGEVIEDGNTHPVVNGKMLGEEISFQAGDMHYKGKVDGNRITGTVTVGENIRPWTATRAER